MQHDNPSNGFSYHTMYPANPLYGRVAPPDTKPTLKILPKDQSRFPSRFRLRRQTQHGQTQERQESERSSIIKIHELCNQYVSSLSGSYAHHKLIYSKFDNSCVNKIGSYEYLASIFGNISNKNLKQVSTFKHLLEANYVQSHCQQSQIVFDSNFESGNLLRVYKANHNEYDLILHNDTNTKGNTQWFYFSVSNLPNNIQITFNIINLIKSDSLFNYGMQPLVKSKLSNEDWYRAGQNVSYRQGQIRREKSVKFYFTLSFQLKAKHPNDTLYVAHSYPYTYSMLNLYLNQLIKCKKYVVKDQIGKSIGNHKIEVLTITQQINQDKGIVLILARQHPGEPQSSYVCEGIIDYLLSDCRESYMLRKYLEFKIIPMVNPDGVVIGNYRTNLTGNDLNRKWDQYENKHSEVKLIKNYIDQLSKKRQIKCILDLHGHSKKMNSFFFCNSHAQQDVNRTYPYMCSKLNKHITFQDCTFSISEDKKQSARVHLGLHYQVMHSYTFQSSFYGYNQDKKKIAFNISDYRNLGTTLVLGVYYLFEHQNNQLQKLHTNYYKSLTQIKQNIQLVQVGIGIEQGSDSNPEECQLEVQQTKQITDQSTLELIKPTNQFGYKTQKNLQQPLSRVKSKQNKERSHMKMSKINSISFQQKTFLLLPNKLPTQETHQNPIHVILRRSIAKSYLKDRSSQTMPIPVADLNQMTINHISVEKDQFMQPNRTVIMKSQSKFTSKPLISMEVQTDLSFYNETVKSGLLQRVRIRPKYQKQNDYFKKYLQQLKQKSLRPIESYQKARNSYHSIDKFEPIIVQKRFSIERSQL